MNRHEGVSCDSCLKGNFPGRRYKCLTCYDYDLCASCYEAGATTTRHTFEHPMQCILTRQDFELYYGGEALINEQSQSFTCPFCGKMGFTETGLQEHVNAEHPDSTVEVVCPICAAHPGGDPNLVTEDFAGHLALEHRPTTRDLISFLDEPTGSRSSVRRISHSARGIGGSRPRRSNMHFSSSGGISSLSPSGRDAVDPIAELLSQLSIVRRSNPTRSSASTQLQQLQIQLQMERQQAARQQLERFPRRQVHTNSVTSSSSGTTSTTVTALSNHVLAVSNTVAGTSTPKTSETTANSSGSSLNVQPHSQLMLIKCMDTSLSEAELESIEIERADRSIFIQDALLNTLMKNTDEEKSDGKRTAQERSSPLQMSSSSSSSQSSTTSTQCSSSDRSAKNGPNEHVSNGSKFIQTQQQSTAPQRTSPSTDRSSSFRGGGGGGGGGGVGVGVGGGGVSAAGSTNTSTAATPFHNRIEYLVPRPLHTAPGTINVGDVLVRNVGNNYTATADTARRKPICTVESINQTSEPPTSH